jgi:hypothetical protein
LSYWVERNLHTEFKLLSMPGSGPKVCGGWWVCKAISVLSLVQAEQYLEIFQPEKYRFVFENWCFLFGRGLVRNAHVAMIITGRIKSSQPNPSARVMDWSSNPAHRQTVIIVRQYCPGLLGTLG